jgi:hypothetical protein
MINTLLSQISRVAALLGCALLVIAGAPAAQACPDGTVFSAYKGNGICVFSGEGLHKAVQCYVRKGGSCPSGTTTEHKNSDKKNYYCCPKKLIKGERPRPKCRWDGEAPTCFGRCKPTEKEVATDKVGDGNRCITGHKAYCCSN